MSELLETTFFDEERPESPDVVLRREQMWPLDVVLAVLGGLVIYTVVTKLDADDPRWLYNPMTYAVSVPLVVVGMSLVLRNVASRFVRRSLQLGFLLSALVHLSLLLAFFNYIVFAPSWSSPAPGTQPVRIPLRKTVPDYLFTRSDLPQRQPDWSRPVEATTQSREVPLDSRILPPLETVDRVLQQPKELPPEQQTLDSPRLTPREQTMLELPSSASSVGELARQDLRRSPSVEIAIEVPEVAVPDRAAAGARERTIDNPARSNGSQAPLTMATSGLPEPQPTTQLGAEPMRSPRRLAEGLPQVGDLANDSQRQTRSPAAARQMPLGAEPAPPSLQYARPAEIADRLLSDRSVNAESTGTARGASPQLAANEPTSSGQIDLGLGFDAPLGRRDAGMAGQPDITAGGLSLASEERQGQLRRPSPLPAGELGVPDLSDLRMAADARGGTSQPGVSNQSAIDRSANVSSANRGAGKSEGLLSGIDPLSLGVPQAMAAIDVNARRAPAGLGDTPSPRIGMATATEQPEIAAIDFGPPVERRRELGGPVAPVGSEITGLRPFDRRNMRTSGSAAPAPAGAVSRESEEAIERGLAYLAERQNADGGWSLQGHGEDVMMRSDTAATGLCLLAFQGAGYTHQQHQYAETVARGLQFLLKNQRANGDLYRLEDRLSNANAWLYSHGIASLALCEAYGMTRDPELRDPAQRCLDFITASQDPRYGGWRYQPRISSDTSVTGWMMMALKSGELSGLTVAPSTYEGINRWITAAQETPQQGGRYRYNPYAPNTPEQAHGRRITPTMTAVGLLARLYLGWERSKVEMQAGADYLAQFPPAIGTRNSPRRDTYYWYYATQVMFHMGGKYWEDWNSRLNPMLVSSQLREGPDAGSWDPRLPIPDRWGPHAGRIYVTAMNLLSLEVYYRHLPIYVETGK